MVIIFSAYLIQYVSSFVYNSEQEKLEGADKNRASAAANLTSQLQLELDEAKRELGMQQSFKHMMTC